VLEYSHRGGVSRDLEHSWGGGGSGAAAPCGTIHGATRFKRIILIFFAQQTSNYLAKYKKIRSALFWDITRRRVVIVYRRFGTT
jgi:hypothetical protein